MTVAELIEALKQMPQDATVGASVNGQYGSEEGLIVELCEDGEVSVTSPE